MFHELGWDHLDFHTYCCILLYTIISSSNAYFGIGDGRVLVRGILIVRVVLVLLNLGR